MIRSFFALIGAFFGYIWSFIRIIRWPLTIMGIFAIIIFLSLSGFAFKTVYDGIIPFLIIFFIISIWIQPLRWVLLAILFVGGIFYAYKVLFLGLALPYANDVLSRNLPAYQEWKETERKLSNNKLAERTIAAKKAIIDSEVTKGTFGIIIEESVAYDENGFIISDLKIKKDQKIMSLGLGSKSQSEDPNGIGTEGMIYVLIANEYGDFVKSRSALVPIRKIEWESNKKKTIKTSSAKTDWEEVEKKVVDFSQVKIVKIAHQQHIAEMILPLNLENGIYRITLNGSYNFRLGGQWYEVAWEGNDRLFAFPDRKPVKDLPCGAVVIFNRGDNITPTIKDGIQINDKLLNPAIQINTYFKDPNEYYSAETRGMILKNSPTKPLTIKIEKEVKN